MPILNEVFDYFRNHFATLIPVCDPHFNTLRPRQNSRHFQTTFLNAFYWMKMYEFRLRFVPKGPINNIPALVQIMAWRRPGDKPLSEHMMVSLLTHVWVTRPRWVNSELKFWINIKLQHSCYWIYRIDFRLKYIYAWFWTITCMYAVVELIYSAQELYSWKRVWIGESTTLHIVCNQKLKK